MVGVLEVHQNYLSMVVVYHTSPCEGLGVVVVSEENHEGSHVSKVEVLLFLASETGKKMSCKKLMLLAIRSIWYVFPNNN